MNHQKTLTEINTKVNSLLKAKLSADELNDLARKRFGSTARLARRVRRTRGALSKFFARKLKSKKLTRVLARLLEISEESFQ